MLATLPIEPVLPRLRDALRASTAAVLQAPPGAGKTTRVPLALLEEPWLSGQRIALLEPRRLAARLAAGRMAQVLGEAPGGTVGYRIRHETRVGPRTRVEVVTEGVLTRMLLADPALEGFGLVIFDEFHERSIHADLGLALALQSKACLRSELRLLVMSATLDGGPIAALLGGAPVVTGEGRSFPVDTRYLSPRPGARVEASVAAAVREALATESGDVLAFLPGTGEIRRAAALLENVAADVIPLHGTLPHELQDRALRASPAGQRKVVLATSIAETSLTIDGVRVVIDSGQARVPRYSPRSGMTRLVTVRVSRASADQRRGRAGRTEPGICYRLWPAHDDASLLPRTTPEILEADLTALALDLADAGADPAQLAWLDPPPAAALAEARSLLTQLGALDGAGRITAHGRAVGRFGLHPRLAHMVLRGRELGAAETACELAALLTERDLLRRADGAPEADLGLRLELLRGTVRRGDVDGEALRRARAEQRICRREAGRREGAPPTEPVSAGLLVAFAYPDRIAQRRPGEKGRFLLRNGQGALLEGQALSREEYLAAAELDGHRRESRVYLAAALSLDEIERHFVNDLREEAVLEWHEPSGSVVARRRCRLGALVLGEAALRDPDPAAVAAVLLEAVVRDGVDRLPWSDAARRLRDRAMFVRTLDPAWPDLSDAALAAGLPTWLGPHLTGLRRMEDVQRLDLAELLAGLLGWQRRAALERLAPATVEVPTGSRITVDYADPAAPVLAVRLQELFGLAETPRVGGGLVPLTLHLLSPARRPVQVTRDLAGFWRGTYFEVRKDLKGRYPKHSWPDDPLAAAPTRHTKRRGSAEGT